MVDRKKVKASIDRYIQNGGQPIISIAYSLERLEAGIRLLYHQSLSGQLSGLSWVFLNEMTEDESFPISDFTMEKRLQEMDKEGTGRVVELSGPLAIGILAAYEEESRKASSTGIGSLLKNFKKKSYERGLEIFYSLLEDNKSRQHQFYNYVAIGWLRFLKNRGIPVDPYISEQLDRVDLIYSDTFFPRLARAQQMTP